MDLYGLLPASVRYYDRFASHQVSIDTGETTLQKILYAFDQEFDVSDNLIKGLKDLLSAETCRIDLLPHLTRFLGVGFFSFWPEGRRRLFVSALAKLYHMGGQKQSWKALLNIMSYSGAYPLQLWKEEVYEDFEYSRYGGGSGYYYLFHAARVDVLSKTGATLNGLLSSDELALLDHFRPIHVLIRAHGIVTSFVDSAQDLAGDDVAPSAALRLDESLYSASDTCTVFCEAHCEAVCEAGSCEGTFEMLVACILSCEGHCETGCEGTCEGGNENIGGISVIDPATGDVIAVSVKKGYIYNQPETAKYSGDIVVTDPATGDLITLYVGSGVLFHPGTLVKFTYGYIVVIITSTGFPAVLTVVNGRIV